MSLIDIVVTHRQGGMREFERTGIYPNRLLITSSKYKVTWQIKITEDEPKSGSLKIKNNVVYNYQFKSNSLKMQEVSEGLPVSKWISIDDMTELLID